MDNSYSYYEMDTFIATILTNLKNPDKELIITNFNPKKVSHQLGFRICEILRDLYGHKISVQMSLIKFIIFKLQKNSKDIYRISKNRQIDKEKLDFDVLFNKIIKSKNYNEDIIEKTYNAYYKKG